jgi:hypothetical protein
MVEKLLAFARRERSIVVSDPKHPKIGDLSVDATDISVVDTTPGRIRHLTKVRDGYEAVVTHILQLSAADIKRAGINPEDIQRLQVVSAEDTHIGELHPASAKLTELLYETRQERRHEIATLLGEFAAQTRRRADGVDNPDEVLGPMETLLDYQYGPARQALATKEAAQKDGKEPDGKGPDGKEPDGKEPGTTP